MTIEIRHDSFTAIDDHAQISIAFEVRTIFEVEVREHGLGGITLVERPVAPWIKNYDVPADNRVSMLPQRFDVASWGLISAWHDSTRIGGAVIAFDTPGVSMLDRRNDLAVLWDLRIAPAWREEGVGSQLFAAVEAWARARGCRQLDIETQNINVPACRFYAAMGCTLRRIDRAKYLELPDEVELLWTKDLVAGSAVLTAASR